MCCKTFVKPIPAEPTLTLIMRIAGFAGSRPSWQRKHEEGSIAATIEEGGMMLRLIPTISAHSDEEHEANAGRAAILFKLAMTLAESCEGVIHQRSLVSQCLVEARETGRLVDSMTIELAAYPERPLVFEALCAGFRRVLAPGVGQDAVD